MKKCFGVISAIVVTLTLLMLESCGTARTSGVTAHRKPSTSTSTTTGKAPAKRTDNPTFSIPRGLDDASTKLLTEAKSWIGTPYLYGGNTAEGIDCSGFVLQVYLKALNIKLPRNSAKQQEFCTPSSMDALTAGDLIFFTVRGGKDVGHVGIYIGDGKFVHASSSRGVTVSAISQKYYTDNFHSAGKVAAYHKLLSHSAPQRAPKHEPKSEMKSEPGMAATPRKGGFKTVSVTPPPSTATSLENDRRRALNALLDSLSQP